MSAYSRFIASSVAALSVVLGLGCTKHSSTDDITYEQSPADKRRAATERRLEALDYGMLSSDYANLKLCADDKHPGKRSTDEEEAYYWGRRCQMTYAAYCSMIEFIDHKGILTYETKEGVRSVTIRDLKNDLRLFKESGLSEASILRHRELLKKLEVCEKFHNEQSEEAIVEKYITKALLEKRRPSKQ
jgi:hypothetical protein